VTRKICLLTLMLLPAAVHDAAAQATLGGDWRADVSAFAQRVVDAGLTPGMGVAVAIGDWVAYAGGFGVADMASGRKATGDTPFYIASSTKSLTATAAVIAAHRDGLDFGAPMVRYLPGARLHDGIPRERLTVHDLAALTHGLDGNGPVVLRTAYTGEFTREQLLDLLRFHPPSGDYGAFAYNNLGFNLLGLVLEAVYDEPWKDVVHRLVLEPLGMESTTAYLSRVLPDRMALPHGATPEGWAPMPLGKGDTNLHAAGGHFASARDLARYLAAHISGGVVEGMQVLPAEPLLLTHRQQVAQDRRFGPYHRHGWGYGWDLGTYEGDTLIHRFGGFAGYRSHMSFMPQHGLGVVVLVNGEGPASPAADLVATYAYERLLGKSGVEARHAARLDSLASMLPRYREGLAEHLAERRARLAPLPHALEAYAGVYESPVLGRMEWRVIADGLEVGMGVIRSRAEVFEAAENRLRIEVAGSGEIAEFVFPAEGGPARSVRMTGVEFTRVDPPHDSR
jgi:CubicO group peptidase (beta-lactamase class C family)